MPLLKSCFVFDVVFKTTKILWCLTTAPLFNFALVTCLLYIVVTLSHSRDFTSQVLPLSVGNIKKLWGAWGRGNHSLSVHLSLVCIGISHVEVWKNFNGIVMICSTKSCPLDGQSEPIYCTTLPRAANGGSYRSKAKYISTTDTTVAHMKYPD